MFKRNKDANKSAPQGIPPQPPQFPTDDDRLVAEAIVFLLDGGEDDAADILLFSSVSFVVGQVYSPVAPSPPEYPLPTYPPPVYSEEAGYSAYDQLFGSMPVERPRGRFTVRLSLPRRGFDAMNNKKSAEGNAIRQALKVVWEAKRASPIKDINFDVTYGRTDPAQQARMTQLVKTMTTNYRKVEGIQVVQQGEPITLRPIPIFPTGPFERDDRLCFVIMPFAAQFQSIYDAGIKPGVNSAGLSCQRGDDIMQPGDILSQIWGGLIAARFVVADVTGANGNVLYELGLAHVVGHQAVLLTQNMNDVPFDLRQQRHIVYTPTDAGLQKLKADLRMALQQLVTANAPA